MAGAPCSSSSATELPGVLPGDTSSVRAALPSAVGDGSCRGPDPQASVTGTVQLGAELGLMPSRSPHRQGRDGPFGQDDGHRFRPSSRASSANEHPVSAIHLIGLPPMLRRPGVLPGAQSGGDAEFPHEGTLSNGREASNEPRSQSGVCFTALPLSAY